MTHGPRGPSNEPPSPPQPARLTDSTAPPDPPGGADLFCLAWPRVVAAWPAMIPPRPNRPSPSAVQCSTGPLWALDLEVAFDVIAEAGFTDLELMVTRDRATQGPERPGELARARGLRIATVHGPFLALTRSVWGRDPRDKVTRGVRMCRALGATRLIVHPPLLWEGSFARWLVEESRSYEDATGVEVAVETMYPVRLAGRSVALYRWVEPSELLRSARRIAMDTSHLVVAGSDVLASFRLLAPRLTHIHLSDNSGDGRDGHLELGEGIVPVDRLLDEVVDAGYAGTLSLELSARRHLERPEELVRVLRRNRERVEQRLSRSVRTTDERA
jgi:sugar phosphate isomerase/epimerase